MTVAELLDRVEDDKSQRILERLSPDEEAVLSDNVDQIVQDCTQTIREKTHKERRRRLVSAIGEAEQAGDEARVQSLKQELAKLYQELAETKRA